MPTFPIAKIGFRDFQRERVALRGEPAITIGIGQIGRRAIRHIAQHGSAHDCPRFIAIIRPDGIAHQIGHKPDSCRDHATQKADNFQPDMYRKPFRPELRHGMAEGTGYAAINQHPPLPPIKAVTGNPHHHPVIEIAGELFRLPQMHRTIEHQRIDLLVTPDIGRPPIEQQFIEIQFHGRVPLIKSYSPSIGTPGAQ